MQVKLKVKRFDPEGAYEPGFNDYTVDMPDSATVLDTLIEVREYHDGTLSLRCSCRSAICGSCAMRINGRARLACKTSLKSLMDEDDGTITVEPAGNLPVIKDLVVDMAPFWDKVRAVEPWLQPSGPVSEREYIVPNDAMGALGEVMNCIMCGACVADCTVMEVDKNFAGPAALAKAWRFVGDPRDASTNARLRDYSEPTGMWDCTRCNMCVNVCPKDVKPMDQIMKLRAEATHRGIKNNNGSRHTIAFVDLVSINGRLDEFRLPVFTEGKLNILGQLSYLPAAPRMIRAGKLPPIFPHKIGGAKHIKRIIKGLEHKRPMPPGKLNEVGSHH